MNASPLVAEDRATARPVTLRAAIVSVAVLVGVLAWVEYSELVQPTSQMSESTPPIPAVLSLGLIAALSVALWRLAGRVAESGLPGRRLLSRLVGGLALSRGEILAIYLFLIVACAMPSVGIIRLILPCLMGPRYFGAPGNNYELMSRYIPRHWSPDDAEAVRTFWEGSVRDIPPGNVAHIPVIGPALDGAFQFFAQSYAVPWRDWATPFLVWTLYLTVYFISSFCLVSMFRRKWAEDDHLNFPIARMSIELFRTGSSPGTGVPFLRDPVAWAGFSIAMLYNATNMIAVFKPELPSMGLLYPIGTLFTEHPWNAMQGLAVWYKPEILGFGYLVPADIQLSLFVFSMVHWLSRPIAAAKAYTASAFPYPEEQATGAMVVLGLYFVYQARGRIAEVWRKAFTGDASIDDSREPISHRAALAGTVLGLAFLVGFPILHGVQAWQALSYFMVGTLFLLVYCRNRAETGLPIVWGYPLLMQKRVLTNFLGSEPFIAPGRIKSFTLLTVFMFLERGTYYAITSSMQESCIVGESLGIGARRTARLLFAAVVIGFVATFWMYLSAYYTWGGNVMETVGGTAGGQRTQIAMDEFQAASQWIDHPSGPKVPERNASIYGAAFALLLIVARRIWFGFPLHPVGYALASCHDNYMWFPALFVYTAKKLTTRIGGNRLYRRLAPGFIAFTLGHFCAIGLWSFAGLYAGDWIQRYRVWFL